MPRVPGVCSHFADKSEIKKKKKGFETEASAFILPDSTWKTSLHLNLEIMAKGWQQPYMWCSPLTKMSNWRPEIETNDWPGISTALLVILSREKIVRLFSVWRVNLPFLSCFWMSVGEIVNKFLLKSCIPLEEFTFLPDIPQGAIKTHQFKRGKGELIFKGEVKNQLPSV